MNAISPARSDVVVLRWPEEEERRPALRTERRPRLLLVGTETDPPVVVDALEDWIRMPASDADLRARVAALKLRAQLTPSPLRPRVEGTLLRYRDAWVAVSPATASIAALLVESFGSVVSAEEISQRVWPHGGGPARAVLNNRLSRLRSQVNLLGLDLTSVRGEGYILEEHPDLVADELISS